MGKDGEIRETEGNENSEQNPAEITAEDSTGVDQNSSDMGQGTEKKAKKTLLGNRNEEKQEELKEEKPESKEQKEKDADSTAEGAPEEYEEFVFSEGFEADKELLEEFTTLAREHNLPQEEAQKYTVMGEKVAKQAYNDAYKKQSEAWDKQQDKWRDEILKDPEIGKNDPKRMERELAGCNAVLDQFADKEFKEELAESGFGNNAGLVRMLHRISNATASDTIIKGGGVSGKKSATETWYGN